MTLYQELRNELENHEDFWNFRHQIKWEEFFRTRRYRKEHRYKIFATVILCVLSLNLASCAGQRGLEQANEHENIEHFYEQSGLENKTDVEDADRLSESVISWEGLTKDGMDEEVFLKDIDQDILNKVTGKLQAAVDEEIEDESADPKLVLTEGWVRIFDKQQYKDVTAIGRPAVKPLYWILYKSDGNGLYEYLCARALQEISGVTFEDHEAGTQGWSTAKEYLELFTNEILGEENGKNTPQES